MKPRDHRHMMNDRQESRASLDDFPTPPWATRAICEELMRSGEMLDRQSVHDPACGRGTMLRPLREYFQRTTGSDVADYGIGAPLADFTAMTGAGGLFEADQEPDWIITNPPFKRLNDFARMAMCVATHGVVMVARLTALESLGRYKALFAPDVRQPDLVVVFTERVPMLKGRLEQDATTATPYCALVWRNIHMSVGPRDTVIRWLPPGTRKRLERAADYGGWDFGKEVLHGRDSEGSGEGDQPPELVGGEPHDDMPGVQPASEEEEKPVPVSEGGAGLGGLVLPSLRLAGGDL